MHSVAVVFYFLAETVEYTAQSIWSKTCDSSGQQGHGGLRMVRRQNVKVYNSTGANILQRSWHQDSAKSLPVGCCFSVEELPVDTAVLLSIYLRAGQFVLQLELLS